MLAGVQQKLVSPSQLREALSRRGPCRHRALIIESILDAAGGIQPLPERDVDRIRRQCGLPPPARQAPVRRPDGRYYLDREWLEYGAAVEIHGIPHLAVRHWEQDLARANEIVIQGARLLVFSSYAVRHEPARALATNWYGCFAGAAGQAEDRHPAGVPCTDRGLGQLVGRLRPALLP